MHLLSEVPIAFGIDKGNVSGLSDNTEWVLEIILQRIDAHFLAIM